MASSNTAYNHARYLLATGCLDLSGAIVRISGNPYSGTWRALLTSSSYAPDLDVHQFLVSVTNELSGNGYSRQSLSGVAVAKGTNRTTFKSNNVVWAASGGSLIARRCILFLDTGNTNTSPLLCSVLLDTTPADVTATDGGTLTVAPDATNGWVYI